MYNHIIFNCNMYNMNFYDSLCRTLTSVYDAILEDLVFPAEIVGKRIRIKLDGSQIIKVHLDKNQQTTIEHKVKHSTLRLDCSHGIVVERYLCMYALLLCCVVGSKPHTGQQLLFWVCVSFVIIACIFVPSDRIFLPIQEYSLK